MAQTARHGFYKWSSGFTQSDTILNDLLEHLEFKLSLSVKSATTTAEPGAPTDGDAYILGATHTGTSWASFAEDDIALYNGTTWVNLTPIEGIVAVVQDTDIVMVFNGAAWYPYVKLALETKITDASTAHAITDPADAPATADALRDDLVANTIPSIETALNNLGTKVNLIIDALEAHYISSTS